MEVSENDGEYYEDTISKKPKYMENIWKTLIFLYSCIIQATTIALSLLDTPTLIVQDMYMFIMYLFASTIITSLLIYLYINRKQTFEEAYKENPRSYKLAYSTSGEKVGLYLRFGLVLIGLFSLTFIVLTNIRVLTNRPNCLNSGLITSSTSQAIFFILQAIFILKYHSIIFLKHTRLIQFGLYNLILVNIITWEVCSLSKISYSGNLNVDVSNCTLKAVESLHLYFLPAVAEYSVIGMAILYEILKRSGKLSLIETLPEHGSSNFGEQVKNSIPGLIIGILIVLVCISFTMFIILCDNMYHASWIFFVHNGEEVFLYIFTIIILGIIFSKTHKLKFSFTFLQNNIDKNLLYVSSFLSIAFCTMISIYCITFLTDAIRTMRLFTALLEMIQIVLQTIVIQDTFYRCTDSSEQHKKKPGQNYFAILIGCNFGLWLLKSFQLKNGDIFFNKYQAVIQNNLLFSFFLYATLPLSVLYRYHSSCCFAGAFSKVYQGEVDRFEGILRAGGFNKCDKIQSKNKYTQNQDSLNCRNINPKSKPRSLTLPSILNVYIKRDNLNDHLPNIQMRRQTLKNLEAAKLRILSSQMSQTLVRKKLFQSSCIEPTSSSCSINDTNIVNDFHLSIQRRNPMLKRHSSNPLELSTSNNIIFSDTKMAAEENEGSDCEYRLNHSSQSAQDDRNHVRVSADVDKFLTQTPGAEKKQSIPLVNIWVASDEHSTLETQESDLSESTRLTNSTTM